MAWEAHKKPKAVSDFSLGSQRACSAHGRRVRHSSPQVAKQLQEHGWLPSAACVCQLLRHCDLLPAGGRLPALLAVLMQAAHFNPRSFCL